MMSNDDAVQKLFAASNTLLAVLIEHQLAWAPAAVIIERARAEGRSLTMDDYGEYRALIVDPSKANLQGAIDEAKSEGR